MEYVGTKKKNEKKIKNIEVIATVLVSGKICSNKMKKQYVTDVEWSSVKNWINLSENIGDATKYELRFSVYWTNKFFNITNKLEINLKSL